MYEYVMPFIIQLVSETRTRETESKKEEKKEKEKVVTATTTLDFVSHDLQLMMPGNQLMLTGAGGAPAGFGSVGGIPPMGGMIPPGMGSIGGIPPMGGFGGPTPFGGRPPY